LDGLQVRLDKELPSVHKPVGERQRSKPLPIEGDFDSQLEAMKPV